METALENVAIDLNSPAAEIRRWRAPMTSTERWVLGAVGALGVLFGLNAARGALDVQARRAALLDKSTAEAATQSPREAEILDLTRRWMVETATADASAFTGPTQAGLGVLLNRNGLYFRAAAPDVTRSMPEAIRSSVKDSVALCLLSPLSSGGDVEVAVTALHARPGSRELDDATRRMARLEGVQRGFRVLGEGWADEVKAADPISLRALEAEFAGRTEAELASARGWSGASYFVAVVDELPEGMQAPEAGSTLAASFRTSMLPDVQKNAHEVRVAVFDIETKAPVLRVRQRVDAPALSARTGLALDDAILAADWRPRRLRFQMPGGFWVVYRSARKMHRKTGRQEDHLSFFLSSRLPVQGVRVTTAALPAH